MTQSLFQQFMTVLMVVLGTMITRFLPFLCFPKGKTLSGFVRYLGRILPTAVFGLLVVYCLKDVSFSTGNRGLPEWISVLLTALIHLLFRKMFLSMACGTLCYMLLIRFIF